MKKALTAIGFAAAVATSATLPRTEHPVSLTTTCTFGWTGEIPQINDGVWVYTVHNKIGNYATDTRVPTLTPGTYTLCVSLGEPDGTPRLALPLKGGKGLRYPVGRIQIQKP